MEKLTSGYAALATLSDRVSRELPVLFERRFSPEYDAKYLAPHLGGPSITIYRDDVSVATNPWREVALLAHEFGHHSSESRGLRRADFYAANKRAHTGWHGSLSAVEISLVLIEECIAWRLGAEMLAQCGIAFPGYEVHRSENLLQYRKFFLVAESFTDLAEDFAKQLVAKTAPTAHANVRATNANGG